MMTVQEVTLDLLQFIGVTGFAPIAGANALNRPGLDTLDVNKALAAINQALQTIQKYGPQSMKQGERASFLRAPTNVAVNTDATTPQSIVFVATPPTWIRGCSILVEGDSDLNRVVGVSGSSVSLLRAYRGITAAGVQATVYADCAQLANEVKSVIEPVVATPNMPLRRARDLTEFMRVSTQWSHQDTVGIGYGTSKPSGQPTLYWTEKNFDGSIYLRVNPMPSAATNLTFQAKLAPQHVTIAALALDGGADPGILFTQLAEDDVETVLLPIARGNFLMHPALKNAETRQSIARQAEQVMNDLRHGAAFETSVGETRATYL